MPPLPTIRRAVLDTNVVLDWLLFGNPDGKALADALASGALRWVATAEMRNELAHVLGRGALDHWQPDPAALWAGWDRHCQEAPTPVGAPPPGRFRCTDPDDQKFIDLAVASAPCLLLSRDRAVLKLGRRLREVGVEALTPAAWAARQTTG